MTDTMTAEQRHKYMSHIRSRSTKPELKMRCWDWKYMKIRKHPEGII